jgi:hypothetical protein
VNTHKKELMKLFHEPKSYQQEQQQQQLLQDENERLKQTIKNLRLKQTLLQIRAIAHQYQKQHKKQI